MNAASAITLGNARLFVLGTVQGLVSEQEAVRSAFKEHVPDAVALPLSNSLIEGVREAMKGTIEEVPFSTENELFATHLRRFGEIQVPPPSLVEAVKLADGAQIPCIPVDLDDDRYDELYLKHVSTIQYFRHIGRMRKLAKKHFKAETPQDFVREWDFHICRLKGFAKLAKAREQHMAQQLVSLLGSHASVLAIVELEREQGITAEVHRLIEQHSATCSKFE